MLAMDCIFNLREGCKRKSFCLSLAKDCSDSPTLLSLCRDTPKITFLELYINRDAMVKLANTTLAMPLVVPKAKLTLDKSFGFTMLCW